MLERLSKMDDEILCIVLLIVFGFTTVCVGIVAATAKECVKAAYGVNPSVETTSQK